MESLNFKESGTSLFLFLGFIYRLSMLSLTSACVLFSGSHTVVERVWIEGNRHFLIPLLGLPSTGFWSWAFKKVQIGADKVGNLIQILKIFFFHISYCWRFVQRWRLWVLSRFVGTWADNWWIGVNTRLELANWISYQFWAYDFLLNQ